MPQRRVYEIEKGKTDLSLWQCDDGNIAILIDKDCEIILTHQEAISLGQFLRDIQHCDAV